ncbi:gap-Pol polyprotein [Clonorchis sinensis]|uniref:Gap-Pol polyprotein n=1 Tax=Clonorchis sinensis TaxID=79923 RepID=G7YMX1_CLOSI|nr:gap-Pol polyprotein [Clonorchis sinensis]
MQPALGAHLRLAKATGQLGVEHLVHLARELAEAPLATFQSQENKEDSTVEDLKNKVDQPTEQLAVVKTESRRHARTSRCYKCGMPGRWRNQCPCTRPLVHNKILEYSSFPWIMIRANSLVVELDPGRLVQLQRQDPVLRKVAAAVLDGRSTENGEGDKELETSQSHFDRLSLNEAGIISWNVTDSDVVLPVIPRTLRRKPIVEYHEMAHTGCTKTYDLLRQRAYWPGMRSEVMDYVVGTRQGQPIPWNLFLSQK